jgi:hypothetical protein
MNWIQIGERYINMGLVVMIEFGPTGAQIFFASDQGQEYFIRLGVEDAADLRAWMDDSRGVHSIGGRLLASQR